MSGRYCNGFDWIAAGASNATIVDVLSKEGWYVWTQVGGSTPTLALETPGRLNYGSALKTTSNIYGANTTIRGIGSQNGVGGFVGCGIYIPSGSFTLAGLCVYDGLSNERQVSVAFTPNGVIRVYTGGTGGTLIGYSDTGTFPNDVWFDLEIFFVVHPTLGKVTVRVNAQEVIALTNQDTRASSNSWFDSVGFFIDGNTNTVGSVMIDDFRYYDTAGTINNSFLGTCRVQTSLPYGAGATTDFSAYGSGSNYLAASNQAIDDTQYVYDPTVGQYDLYTATPLVNSPTVFYAQVTGFYRQDDATQRYVKNQIKSGSVLSAGSEWATSEGYTSYNDIWELDPNTGLTFTGSAINALEFGPLVYA